MQFLKQHIHHLFTSRQEKGDISQQGRRYEEKKFSGGEGAANGGQMINDARALIGDAQHFSKAHRSGTPKTHSKGPRGDGSLQKKPKKKKEGEGSTGIGKKQEWKERRRKLRFSFQP